MNDEFEKAAIEELEAIDEWLKERRQQQIRSFSPSTKNMGKMFALGAVDSAIWRLLRRARGEIDL